MMNRINCSRDSGGGLDWSSLPDNVLCDISSRLTFSDYEAFGRVCTSWKSAKGPLSPQMPFLLVMDCEDMDCEDMDSEDLESDYKLLRDIFNGTYYRLYMPCFNYRSCIGFQEGWLIVVDYENGVVSVYDPFTEQEIELYSRDSFVAAVFILPNGENSIEENMTPIFSPIRKVIMSSVPNSCDDLPQTIVVLFHDDFAGLGFKRACDRLWYLLCDRPKFVDIVCWRGQFLVVGLDGSVYRLDFVNEPYLFLVGPEIKPDCDVGHCEDIRWNHYLVELDDKLLQVRMTYHLGLDKTTVKVVKLDENVSTWITMDNLCGYSLFFGTSYSVCLSSQQTLGLKADMIYFYHLGPVVDDESDSAFRKQYVEAFNLRNETFENLPHLQNCPKIGSIWFAPKPIKLRTDHICCRNV